MLALLLATAAVGPDAAIGRWKTESKNAIVEIAPCGASVCGRLATSDGLRADPGMTDRLNKDPTLRGRKLLGLEILGGFTRTGAGWTGGHLYKADDGGTYKGSLIPIDANHLQVKGCWLFICKNQTLTRSR